MTRNEFQSAVRIAVWLKLLLLLLLLHVLLVSIRRADRCLVEAHVARWRPNAYYPFQSAVRIAVWLKASGTGAGFEEIRFQSAVRIAVWLKHRMHGLPPRHRGVSIRRADRCLVEGSVASAEVDHMT